MALLDEPDARRWAELGGRVAASLERRLDPRVVANRSMRAGAHWGLQPLGPALRRAGRLGAGIAARSPAVLRTDVAVFYPSVRPGTLHRALRAVAVEPTDAAAAADFLDGWGSHDYPGLPIGPPASAVMANAVLRPVDRALRGLPFVRWVDDYLIGLPDAALAPALLCRMDETLDELGLTRSVPKTTIGLGGVAWLGGTLSLAGGPDRARCSSS